MYLLDCDTGVDDAVAILHLLGSGAPLAAVTVTFGNVSAAQAAENTLRVLHLAGRSDVPVAVGGESTLDGTPTRHSATLVHGANGLGGAELEPSPAALLDEAAPELIVRLAHEQAGELRIIATGGFTNLARALELDPAIAGLVREVTLMGGAALVPGNVTPSAEANIVADPLAAAAVLGAGWPVVLVPLDVTMTHLIEHDDWQRLADAGGVAGSAAAVLDGYLDFYAGIIGRRCAAMHDALAVAIALGEIEPELAPRAHVEVDVTDGPGRGRTIADLRHRYRGYAPPVDSPVRVVLEARTPLVPSLVERILAF